MNSSDLRVAIVTGASRGIGAAVAQRLAKDGIAIIVNYLRDRDAAEQVVGGIAAGGGHALAVQADLAEPSAMARLFDVAERELGGSDILVNNGGMLQLGAIAETTDEAFERQLALNLGGTFRGMREAARRLRDNGRIINFSSSVVGSRPPGYGVYAATKAAVEALTHIAAKELGERGITINAVAPGPVETALFLEGKSDELVRATVAANPFKRLGRPDDVAGVVSFLAGPDAGWVNGQIIRANGGIV